MPSSGYTTTATAAYPAAPNNRIETVILKAKQYGVPLEVLIGVYGVETRFGENVATSSAGAKGHFQFIEATARAFNYPYTNKPTQRQFEQQVDAAARYLKSLKEQYGDWDKAIHAYSSGNPNDGYGLKEAKDAIMKAGGLPSIPGLDEVKDAANDIAGAAADVGEVIGQFFSLLTSLEFWLRLGQGIAGLVLIAFGLKTLTGVSVPTPIGKV